MKNPRAYINRTQDMHGVGKKSRKIFCDEYVCEQCLYKARKIRFSPLTTKINDLMVVTILFRSNYSCK